MNRKSFRAFPTLLLLIASATVIGCAEQAATPAAAEGRPAHETTLADPGRIPARDLQAPTPAATTPEPAAPKPVVEAPKPASTPPRKDLAAQQPRPAEAPAMAVPAPVAEIVVVPAGTEIELEMLDTLSSGTSQVGDGFRARLTHDVVVRDRTLIPTGAEVRGTVTEVVPLKNFGGQPMLTVAFDSIRLADGSPASLQAAFTQAGPKQALRDAAKIGGGAIAGAVLGHQIDGKKGQKIGAILGSAAGVAAAAKTGQEAELATGALIVVTLDADLRPGS